MSLKIILLKLLVQPHIPRDNEFILVIIFRIFLVVVSNDTLYMYFLIDGFICCKGFIIKYVFLFLGIIIFYVLSCYYSSLHTGQVFTLLFPCIRNTYDWFCRQHFQMLFHEGKYLKFGSNRTELYSLAFV